MIRTVRIMHTTNIENIKRGLLLTIMIMLVVMAYQIWKHNQKTQPPQAKKVQLETDADLVVKNIELTETSGSRIYWKLKAKVAEIYTSTKQTRLEDLEIDFFDEDGKKSMHLVSDEGTKDDNTGNIVVSGNVQATAYQEDATLKTSELVYDAETKLITSDKHVIVESGGLVTSGDGLESDLRLSDPRILRNVTTTILLEKQGE